MNRHVSILLRCAFALLLLVNLMPAADALAAGNYKGSWTGANGGGDFHMTLTDDGKGGFTGTVGFTINSTEVPGKITTLKVTGSKIEMSYDFDLDGNKLTSAAAGTLKGKSLEGSYKTTAGGQDVDTGTWKVALAQ